MKEENRVYEGGKQGLLMSVFYMLIDMAQD
jgi:hypothetical protein